MGNQASSVERDACELMRELLKKHGKAFSDHDLKLVMKWVHANIPSISALNIFTSEIWDKAGMKLWDAATKNDAEAQKLLSGWRIIFETLKKRQKEGKQRD